MSGHWAEEAWAVVPHLADEYYVGFWTAMGYWGMTEQILHTVFVATPKRRKSRVLEFGNQRYEFVTLSRRKFFGHVEEGSGRARFNISGREKTLVDGLTHPGYCGGIPEVAKAMWNARREVDWNRVLETAERTGIGVVLQRLGYLLSVLQIEDGIAESVRARIRRHPYKYLDPSAAKERIGTSADYGLVINRTREELLGWRDY